MSAARKALGFYVMHNRDRLCVCVGCEDIRSVVERFACRHPRTNLDPTGGSWCQTCGAVVPSGAPEKPQERTE